MEAQLKFNFWSERSACASATKWPLNYALFSPPLSLSPLSSSSRHLLNLQERVVVGFPNFAWAPK